MKTTEVTEEVRNHLKQIQRLKRDKADVQTCHRSVMWALGNLHKNIPDLMDKLGTILGDHTRCLKAVDDLLRKIDSLPDREVPKAAAMRIFSLPPHQFRALEREGLEPTRVREHTSQTRRWYSVKDVLRSMLRHPRAL